MCLTNYIVGPQLIGFIFFMAGFIMQRFPPKNINTFYGYRTGTSMKNQQTWDEGNRFSARWMVGCGMVVFILGILLTIVLNVYVTSARVWSLMLAASFFLSAIIPAVLVIVLTEKHLNKMFNNQDEIR